MINYSRSASDHTHKRLDATLISTGRYWNSQVAAAFKGDPFDSRFLSRYWLAFNQEFNTLTPKERYLPFAAYFGFRNLGPDLQLHFTEGLSRWGYHDGKTRQQMDAIAQKGATYDRVRQYLFIADYSRAPYEDDNSPEYYLIKTVFFLRYAARATALVSPQVKAAIRNMFDRIHTQGNIIQLIENHQSTKRGWEDDKAKLINLLSTNVTGFRVKHARVDTSIRGYWGV